MAEPRILRDLRVFRPEPRGVVIYGEPPVTYAIRSVVDMRRKDIVRLLELETPTTLGINGGPSEPNLIEHYDRLGEQIPLLAPAMSPDVLDQMTYRERLDFVAGALSAAPPPLLESLTRLLEPRPLPCDGACEHTDCPPLRELWIIKERLSEANPTTPAPAVAASVPATSPPMGR